MSKEKRYIDCPACKGTARSPHRKGVLCKLCEGTGLLRCTGRLSQNIHFLTEDDFDHLARIRGEGRPDLKGILDRIPVPETRGWTVRFPKDDQGNQQLTVHIGPYSKRNWWVRGRPMFANSNYMGGYASKMYWNGNGYDFEIRFVVPSLLSNYYFRGPQVPSAGAANSFMHQVEELQALISIQGEFKRLEQRKRESLEGLSFRASYHRQDIGCRGLYGPTDESLYAILLWMDWMVLQKVQEAGGVIVGTNRQKRYAYLPDETPHTWENLLVVIFAAWLCC